MATITTQSANFTPPFQVGSNESPDYTTLQARADIAPIIGTFALNPNNLELVDKFDGSPLASLFGFQISGRQLDSGSEGLMKGISSFRAVNKVASSSYKMQIWQKKKYWSKLVLNANTVASGGAGLSITAAFNLGLGGYPVSQGDILRLVDAGAQVVLVRCTNPGTINSSTQVQSGVVLFPLESTITIGIVQTTAPIVNLGRQSGTISVGSGYFTESTQFARDYELAPYNNRRNGVLHVDALFERQWFKYKDNGTNPILNSLSNAAGMPQPGNYQFWQAQALNTIMIDEMKTLHDKMMFDSIPASPSTGAYATSVAGDKITAYDGIVTQIENRGYDVVYALGAMTAADFTQIYYKFRDDKIGGHTFDVSAGRGFISQAQPAMAAGITAQTLLNVVGANEAVYGQDARNAMGLARRQGFTAYIDANGGTFRFKELPNFSDPLMADIYNNSAIIVPVEEQSVMIDGVKTNAPAILFAYAGDTQSPLLQRSGGEYSGKAGFQPFISTNFYVHPTIKDKLYLSSSESSTVSVGTQSGGNQTGDVEFIVTPHYPIVTCVEATAFMHT